ncbi:MAG: DUF2797 domain-containing protein [Gammaproteobacteria bacterium]
MNISGNLAKMHTSLVDGVAQYQLPIGDTLLPMNELIGQTLQLHYTSEINCIACGRKTKKSFNQGYCFPCFRSLARCDMCIVKPETCHYFEGTCREPAWGVKNCMQDHVVYLANSSGIKVGITRGSQIPTRWMDQGATQALPIYRVKNRLISGKVEVAIKQHVADKTDWRRMLKAEADGIDLAARRDALLAECQQEIKQVADEYGSEAMSYLANEPQVAIRYPVTAYPRKVVSFNLEKDPVVAGTLMGIKGQYLIFDSGVINIRKFGGYKATLTT